MPTWKKVVVSGSAISQLLNDAGYLTSVTAQNSFVTMSVNGTNVLADSAVDTLTFASSSGAGLNIVGDAGADSITFNLGNIPNASLANSAVTVTAGAGLTGGGSISLGSSATVDVGAGTHITVNANDIAVNTTTLTPAISGSIFTQVSGDISITAGGVATIGANSVALGTDTTGDYVATVTSGNGLTGGTSGEGSNPTLAVGAGTHITVNPDDVAVNTTTLTPAISGSIFTQVVGDITITAGGVATIAANSVALGTDTTGNYVQDITAGAGINTLSAASEGTQQTISVNSGSMLPYYSGSIFSTVSGDITITAAGNAQIGSGVITNTDVNASAAIAASKINFSGTSIVSGSTLSSGAQGEVVLTTNGVAGSTIDLGLQTTDSPTFVDLTLTGGDLNATTSTTFNLINANQTTVNFAGAATTLNMGNASGTTTIAGNAIVQGDFTVNGTTTYVNVQDLYVEDKFIVLASGSATAGDGGIIIDRGSDAAGNIAYGFDSVTDRWGFQSGLTDSTNTFDPTSASGVSGSFVPYLFTEANHGATKPITGEFAVVGSMYMSTAGDFWIYTV